jgi:hypothetical protein
MSYHVVQVVEVDFHGFLGDPECSSLVTKDMAPSSTPETLTIRIDQKRIWSSSWIKMKVNVFEQD